MRVMLLWTVCVALCAVGCSSGQTRQFGVELKNNSTHPLTVGLVKVGLPMEKQWESPEDHALMDPRLAEPSWGVLVTPGHSVYIDKVKGEFEPGGGAFLRVYVGQLDLSQLLAVNRSSRGRVDVPLRQGRTVAVAMDHGPFVDVTVTTFEPWGDEAGRRAETFRDRP